MAGAAGKKGVSNLERIVEIKARPDLHRHDYPGLIACCTLADGAVSLELMDLHCGTVPTRNPGGCDVLAGPCCCGAWH